MSNGLFMKDRWYKEMKNREFLPMMLHYQRNNYNIDLPDTIEEAINEGFSQMAASSYHQEETPE
jgi:hypothetical protein